ncbi:hypothetical protein SAMN05443635_11468 [Roseobacter denitrificans OCh 114]|nr:hypothetical protein SAMN05443635_11468 [Roseobacter denitrificans OCh 114]
MVKMTLIDDAPLRRTARRFELGFQAASLLMVALAGGVVVATLVGTAATGAWLASLTGHAIEPQPWQSFALAAVACFGLGLYAATFSAARAVSRILARAELAAAGQAARTLSRWVWAVLVWSIIAHTLAVLIATAHAGPGQRALSIAIGSPQVSLALAALMAAFLAQALTLVAALWEDHKEIV